MNENMPLMPESALIYFESASEISYPEYLRAYALRNCLENIVNTVFMYLTDKPRTNKKKWIEKINLSEKIKLSKNYFSDDTIFNKLINIKNIGDKGHPDTEKHKTLTHEEINLALKDVEKICEWIIIIYIKKHGLHTESSIPTMLSTLNTSLRVTIQEELFDYFKQNILNKQDLLDYLDYVQHTETIYMNAIASGQISFELYKELTSKPLPTQKEFSQTLLLIDKLAMAYLKNGDYPKANKFIHSQFKEEFINETFRNQMLDKLDSLEKAKNQLPISQSLEETKGYFKEILAVVQEEEHSLFITLFTAIVAQDELNKRAIENK